MNKGLALVTGADGGMGTVHTRTLAEAGYEVIMACYDTEVAKPVYEKIKNDTGANLHLMQVDLADLQSVIRFADEVKNQFSSLQILLNNAGVLCHHAKTSKNGMEYTIAVNYFGHYVLDNLLLPIMGQGTRVASMVSLAYKYGKIDEHFFEPKTEAQFNRFTAYSNSKLALYYYTLEAAEAWKDRGITINCADPNIVSTEIIRQGNIVVDKLCDWIFRPLINTPEQGAATMLKIALSPEAEGVTGSYFKNQKVISHRKRLYNNLKQRNLLKDLTRQMIEKNNLPL